jgi:hypothetical protein
MYEPIDPPRPVPPGGWPKATRRVELVGVTSLAEAIYELACLARHERLGQVATFQGSDLYAYPHQTTSEIGRSHETMRRLAGAGQVHVLKPVVKRWTRAHKAGVVLALRLNVIDRYDVLKTYEISEEELAGWETRYAAYGLEGLAVNRAQDGRRANEPEMEAARG